MSTCGDGEMGNALCHTRTHTHTHTRTHKRSERQTERHTHPVAICRNELAGLRAGSRHMAAQTDLTRPRPSQQTNNCEMHFDMSTARRKKRKHWKNNLLRGRPRDLFLPCTAIKVNGTCTSVLLHIQIHVHSAKILLI